jgi:hypothetical protein
MALKRSTLASSGSGFATNDFTVSIGASGYTSIPLSNSFPAGSYICTSSLSDATLDIYLINEDGTSAGYANATTATTTISASKSFNKLVIYGGANNDTLTFQFKYVFSPTSASTSDFAAVGPKITSVSVSSLPNQNDTTVISGFNFATDVAVSFTGTGYSSTSAKSIVRSSSTSLLVTRPDNFPTSASPFTITVSNPGVASPTSTNSHVLSNSVTSGSAPVWVTSATLTNFVKSVSYSQVISATDADGGSSVTYSIVSGSLPTGITFNTSTATFSGTPTQNSGTPYSYTVRATDSGANYVDRTFSLSQAVSDAPTSVVGTDVGTSRAYNNGAVSVAFSNASYIGTSSITSYTVTASTGQTNSGASSPIIVTGIATGATPTFTVTATNSGGTSLSSSASSSVTVTTVPGAPTIGTASITNTTTASVTFTAGLTGGKSITSYVGASSPSISVSTSAGTTSPVSVTGSYAQAQSYTFALAAVNANGTSDYSAYSNGITPLTLPTASGGTLGSDATYYYRTFTSNGNLVVSTGSLSVTALMVAGGGSGGYSGRETDPTYGTYMVRAGGGGAGGLIEPTATISPGTYPIVIGAGGVYNNGSGSSSSFNGNTAIGGGYGTYSNGASGGSGGGGGSITAAGFGAYPGGAGTSGQGNAGSAGTTGNGGGGGGKGSAGTVPTGGTGGLYSAYASATGTGSGGYYAGGGAGTTGSGGAGGGGNSTSGSIGANGAANTGGGAGGGGYTNQSSNGTLGGGNGGSGIVIIRYARSAVAGG